MNAKKTRPETQAATPVAGVVGVDNETYSTEVTGATVLRFRPGGGGSGVSALESSGFSVASASDFSDAAIVPENFGGADVQYFERFGIAIVQNDPDRLRAMMSTSANAAIANARPERIFHALGYPSKTEGAGTLLPASADRFSREYLTGYRDGLNQVIDHLLGAEPLVTGMDVTGQELESTWGLQATKALNSRHSGKGVRVAVLDTGFDFAHQDFTGRHVEGKSFVPGEEVQDRHGHGTHCIGTACGPLRPAGVPRYGVAWEADIYAGKVLSNAGRGSDRSIIAGINWALDNKCAIISMSLGAATNPGDGFLDDYEDIAKVALGEDAVIIAAAGNESRRPQFIAPVSSPANCPSILAVGAVDSAMNIAWFSCGGVNLNQNVDIVGPGVEVFSSVPGGHRRMNGTSMATPHVAGIAALLAQSNRQYRGLALWGVLLQHCQNVGLGSRDAGKGLVQAPY